jgi:hypothetical protein
VSSGVFVAAHNLGGMLDGLGWAAQLGESARCKEGYFCAVQNVVIGWVAGLTDGG